MELTTIHDQVREYYGRTLGGSDDLHTDAPHCETAPPPKYVRDVMPLLADEVIARFYGCGSPIPPALEGATVLDLGCGTGRDVYVLSKLVGPTGRVIGVDMTPEQLEVAQRYQQEQAERFGFAESNVEFRLGYIEDLASCGIEDESVDLVVSNCVVNLSPFKQMVMDEVFRVLKPGGELYFSDVYASRRLPDEIRNDPVVHGECLGGATYAEDFRQLMRRAGWPHIVWTVDDPMHVGDLAIEARVGFTSFRSRTIRAIKCDGLEETEEDYGQHATYLGGMPEMPRYFDFDVDQRFIKGKTRAVSGNTARMLKASRYGRFFEVSDPRLHRGPSAPSKRSRCVSASARSTSRCSRTLTMRPATSRSRNAWGSRRCSKRTSARPRCRSTSPINATCRAAIAISNAARRTGRPCRARRCRSASTRLRPAALRRWT